ncbi:unnamed protein product [Rotaria sp. Silwood2]|nr:unnamed protein product [Rotaria sp. Silwood2]CAF4114007.1 unnamed protein product [Rotaria sp. Silwood2]
MKLPIEKTEDRKEDTKKDSGGDTEEDPSTQTTVISQQEQSDNWNHFVRWIQRMFGYQRSSTRDQPSYRTTVYSLSKIEQFIKFFDKRNRSEPDPNYSSGENKLRREWATIRKCLKPQPFDLIRSYMGEKVAFYFAAMDSYTIALILPSIVGLIVFIYGAATVTSDKSTSDICGSFGQNIDMCPLCDKTCSFWKLSDSCTYAQISYVFDNVATVIFAILMSIWARGFVEWWKRSQSEMQYQWDSIDFQECNEPIRADFEKKVLSKRVNPRTGVSTFAAVIAWTSEFIPKLTYKIIEGKGTSLDGYVNWTLSSFSISDYNKTGTLNPNIPSNLTYCRYRDFRESTGPNYDHTSLYWHTISARLAFMIIFENVIYLIVYLVQLMVSDVSSQVQEGIDRQRYGEQSHQDSSPKNPSAVEEAIQIMKTKSEATEK